MHYTSTQGSLTYKLTVGYFTLFRYAYANFLLWDFESDFIGLDEAFEMWFFLLKTLYRSRYDKNECKMGDRLRRVSG